MEAFTLEYLIECGAYAALGVIMAELIVRCVYRTILHLTGDMPEEGKG